MAKLSYKTKGGANPQGMQKIYFACHPDDLDTCFESICEDIFATQNCAIFYNSEPETPWDVETMNFELSRMQLIVIPVTLKFLRNPCAELSYAFEKHIPILPLMQDSGIESEYEKVFGDLQFLDKTAIFRDPAMLPYDQKLKRYLESILFGDELIEKIRDAFDAYIFMSYRKKDRKHAQNLMRLIHQNEFCRDIAIWYDEYLVPGEHFTEAIEAALKKSELFTLVVTPSLLELNDKGEKNYVVANEYPVAVKERKEILPVIMGNEKLDLEVLRKNLNDVPNTGDKLGDMLPEPTNGEDATALTQALQDKLPKALLDKFHAIAIDENNSDPVHNYFIGLAYLGGIDVEIDYNHAVSLITSAATLGPGLPEAMKKLADMYQTGEGVEKNFEIAIQWLEKRVKYREKRYGETDSEYDGVRLLKSLHDSGDTLRETGQLINAQTKYERAATVAEKLLSKSESEYYLRDLRNLALCYSKLGEVCNNAGNLYDAEKWYKEGLKIRKKLVKESRTNEAYRDLAISYERIADLYKLENNLLESQKCQEISMGIFWNLAIILEEADFQRNLAVSYGKMGDIYRQKLDLPEARKWYEKSLEISERLFKETGKDTAHRDLAIDYEKLADIYRLENNLLVAQEWQEKSLKIFEQLVYEKGIKALNYSLAVSYIKVGSICALGNRISAARDYYEEGLKIFKQLSDGAEDVEIHDGLAYSYYRLATVNPSFVNITFLKNAESIWDRLVKQCPSVPKYAAHLHMVQDLLKRF